MKCSKCGYDIPDGASFCRNCGEKVAAAQERYCVHCGAKLDSDSVFCTECGSRNDGITSANEQPGTTVAAEQSEYTYNANAGVGRTPKSDADKKKTAVIAAVAAVVAFAVIVIVGGYMIKETRKNIPSSSVSESKNTKKDKKASKPKSNRAKKNKKKVNEISRDTVEGIVAASLPNTNVGIYVKNLSNGYEFGYRENESFLASAMGQVVILDTLSDIMRKQDISPDDEYLYFSYMPNGKEAPDSKNQNGDSLGLKKYIEDVAVYGDNNKSNTLVDYIARLGGAASGFDVINKSLSDKGMTVTKINRKTFINPALVDNSVTPNVTSPKEIAGIFEELINKSAYGSKSYMTNIFRCQSTDGSPVGMKKFIPDKYTSCNANALTGTSTNDVALISDGKTEIAVAILMQTDDAHAKTENDAARKAQQQQLIEYIVQNQFSSGE